MCSKFSLLLLGLLICISSFGQFVTKVRDGDTFYTSNRQRIRLAEADCPELKQRFGWEARNYLKDLILYKTVTIVPITKDIYGRTIAEVYVDGIWVNKAIVDAGYAWAYKGLSVLHTAQIQARKAKKGIWREPYNQPPFKFR